MTVLWVGNVVNLTVGIVLVGWAWQHRSRPAVYRGRIPAGQSRSWVTDGYTWPSDGVARVARGEEKR